MHQPTNKPKKGINNKIYVESNHTTGVNEQSEKKRGRPRNIWGESWLYRCSSSRKAGTKHFPRHYYTFLKYNVTPKRWFAELKVYTFVVYVTAVLVYKRFLQEAEAPDTVIFSNESSNTAFTFIHPMFKLCSTGNYCCDFIVTIFAKFLQAVFLAVIAVERSWRKK